ncbi:uncharacterized protein LOC125771986 isoform X3 [Anopheles funestus]|uniref:uncharacterized protein LOC125771986 isoform X3 n=1 Tax=Anopheles funestus TaxID=62324 RepID=UPI0020C6E3D4|nr:uncharacterized protein LOC125771986 isoform X3 [Anopheles funestus]
MAEEEQRINGPGKAEIGLKFYDSLSSRIEQFVNNEFMSDVTFIVGPEKQRIFAHRLHLVTASKYFYTMFYGNFAEAELDEIELKDEDPEIFITMMHIVYGAKVEINDENILGIYNRMKMYLLPKEYYKPLIKFLSDQIVDKDTAMKIFRENNYYEFASVDALCIPYIQNNPLYYFRKDDFSKIEEEIMRKIVCLQQINCTDEQLLFALETCEFTHNKFDSKTLKKLVSNTARKYFAHKLPFLSHTTYQQTLTAGAETFSLKLTSGQNLSLYGIGVYMMPTVSTALARLCLRDIDNVYKEICVLNFVKRLKPCLEIVDLMFEEIVLALNRTYEFRLTIQNNNGVVVFSSCGQPSLKHKSINITFAQSTQNQANNALAHLWVKNPNCQLKENQEPQSWFSEMN